MNQLEACPLDQEKSEEIRSDRKDRFSLYMDAAFAMFEQDSAKASLIIYERGVRKQVTDMLLRRPPVFKRERHKILWGNMRFLKSRLQELQNLILKEKAENGTLSRLRDLKSEESRLALEYNEVLNDIKDEDEVLAWLSGAGGVNIEPAQASLTGGKGAISFLMGRTSTLIWAVDSDSIRQTSIDFGYDYFAKRIAKINSGSDVEARSILEQLYTILIAPLSDWIDTKEQLIIIPDRDMWNLPFAALSDGDMALLDRVDIIFCPGLSVYHLADNNKKVGLEQGLFAGSSSDLATATAFSNLLVETDVLLSGKKISESQFIARMQDADIIHAERWSIFYEDDPFYSAIALVKDKKSDGYLRSFELFSHDLKAGLAVLPPAPVEQMRKYDAPLSFFYSLLYAGVPTMVTRIKAVNNQVKAAWGRHFYENLKTMSTASALAEAQIVLRDSSAAIRDWASFQIIGFGGLDVAERIAFARDNLVANVREGQAYEQQGEFQRALNLYDQAVGMAVLLKDSLVEGRILDIALAASVRGTLWKKAAGYQTRIEKRAKQANDMGEIKSSLKNLIAIYRRGGKLTEAANAESRYNQMLGGQGDANEQAGSNQEMAMLLALDKKWDEALFWAEKACSLYTRIGNKEELGRALLRKGRINLEADNFWQAGQDLQKGIGLLEFYPDAKNKFEIGSGYQLLGLAEERMSRYKKAISFQEQGLKIFKKLAREAQIAQGIQYLANLYWKTGDFRKAVLKQEEALNLFKNLNDAKLLSMGYSTRGLINMGLGKNEDAVQDMQHALRLAESSGSREDQSAILKNMGLLAINKGAFSNAEKYFQRAAVIDSVVNSKAGLAYSLRNLGVLKARMGQGAKGLPLLEKSLVLSQQMGDQRNEIQSYYGLGLCLNEAGLFQKAVARLDSGLTRIKLLNMPDLEWRLLWLRAGSLRSSGHSKPALRDFTAAIATVEKMRHSLSAEAFKQGFLEDKAGLYADMISFQLELKRPAEALKMAERAKSRSFIDMLAKQSEGRSRVSAVDVDQEFVLADSLDDIRVQIRFLEEQDQLKPDETEQLLHYKTELENLELEYEGLISRMQAENPESASLVRVEPLDSDEIRALVPDSTALLEYYIMGRDVFIWVVKQDRILAVKTNTGSETPEVIIRRFRTAILSMLSSDKDAQELYSIFIKPISEQIKDVNHLVIIPHAILHYCPFNALQDENGKILLEKYSISLAPSSTVLGFCRKKSEQRVGQDNLNILAISNPDLGADYNLPFADREVSSLKRTFNNVTVLAGAAATETAVRQQAGNYDILHFACHAEFKPDSPLFSALLLTTDEKNNGRLEAHEIFNLKLNCDLVTLSACESGLGRIAGGDDIVGLARAFIYAGAPSLVTSLWKVDDLATAVMIKRFYRYLRQGKSKAEAIKMAQLWVREYVNPQPAAWAGFNLIGEFN